MQSNYTASIYLTPNDLNQVENKVEELTNKIRQKIYNNTSSALRNIQVGDDLSRKTLYLSLPRRTYEELLENMSDGTYLIKTDGAINESSSYSTAGIVCQISTDDSIINTFLNIVESNGDIPIYAYTSENNTYDNPNTNYLIYKLPKDFGTVTEINTNNNIFQYIKIYDNENIIPNYIKKVWVINELPYVQYIYNIENGIENLGKYFTKPSGWISTRDWGGSNNSSTTTNIGTGSQSFSYNDINRWINNLNLIENSDMDDVTVWNTNKSQYYWNQ